MNKKYLKTVFLFKNLIPRIPIKFSIITAFNPMDKIQSKDTNIQNNILLYDEIRKLTNSIIPVTGCSPNFDHKEDSFLSNISITESVNLGKKFNQRAVFIVNQNELSIKDCNTLEEISIGQFKDRIIFKK